MIVLDAEYLGMHRFTASRAGQSICPVPFPCTWGSIYLMNLGHTCCCCVEMPVKYMLLWHGAGWRHKPAKPSRPCWLFHNNVSSMVTESSTLLLLSCNVARHTNSIMPDAPISGMPDAARRSCSTFAVVTGAQVPTSNQGPDAAQRESGTCVPVTTTANLLQDLC